MRANQAMQLQQALSFTFAQERIESDLMYKATKRLSLDMRV